MKDEDIQHIRLTEEDRQVIADLIWKRARNELYINAGKGLINVVWRMIILGFFALAVYGWSKGWFR